MRGRVQGVGFRWFVLEEARRLGLRGDVRNLPDGSVEVRAAGAPAPLRRMRDALDRGPASAAVQGVQENELRPLPAFEGFEIRR